MMKAVSKKRDWQKDWELCQRATPGKWEIVAANNEGPYMIRMPYHEGGMWYGIRMVFWKEDAEFIAEAREALLYWLQKVKELETALKIMEKQLDIAAREITHVNLEFDTCPSEYDRELTCTCNGTIADVYRCWRERWKQKALAALKESVEYVGEVLINGGSDPVA